MTAKSVVKRWEHPRVSEAWRVQAGCIDENPEFWFPERGCESRDHTVYARAVCGVCPGQAACLEYAIEVDAKYGIWGGLTQRERAQLIGRKFYP